MVDTGNDEDLKRLLKAAYSPVSPPFGIRECLEERLVLAASGVHRAPRPLRTWLPIAVGLISGAIGYGAWLSLNLAPMLMH